MENEFVEFDTRSGDVILIKLANITLVKKVKRKYPDFEYSYEVCVNNWYYTLDGQEGEVVYAQYKEYLKSCVKQ